MTRGRIIYHAYKEHLIPSNVKCTFNNKANIFELRPTLNNSIKIDWNSEAIHISELNFNKWKLSYEHYLIIFIYIDRIILIHTHTLLHTLSIEILPIVDSVVNIQNVDLINNEKKDDKEEDK